MTTQEILLIEDSDDDAFLVSRTIEKQLPGRFQVSHKKTMAEAEAYIREHKGDVCLILLDLGLPDTKNAHDSFNHIKTYAAELPIVVLTGMEDHELALALVREGAEDFVNKGLINEKPELLQNVLEFATCRHQLMDDNNKKHAEKVKEKDDVISWMGGGYSIK